MPELPEVETIRRVLEPVLMGQIIQSAEIVRPEVIAYPDAETFCREIAGQRIVSLSRRGKFLSICFESGSRAVLHLRMTGCLLLLPADAPREKHTHAIFQLDSGEELRFSDLRRFGRFWLLKPGEKDIYTGMDKLGLEPFDENLSAGYLKQRFGGSKRAVKTCLLDQTAVAGIGNIYSDEILFAAGIAPSRPACSLNDTEWARLAAAIPERLGYFIEKNALTLEEYLASGGREYRNTPFFQVYGREGQPCPHCGAALVRVVIGGRSSVSCPICQ